MNGEHDLGGTQSFGPVPCRGDETVFHAPWEARIEAMTMVLLAGGHFGGGGILRYGIESLPPLHYLQHDYFERHLDGLEAALVQRMLLRPDEIHDRLDRLACGAGGDVHRVDMVRPAGTPAPTQGGEPSNRRHVDYPPQFEVGNTVIARNIHSRGHTRLPRYVRGRCGRVTRIHAAAIFPDTDAHGMGENPQFVYTVSFDSHELWGSTAEPNQAVQLGLWESYLVAA